MLPLLFAALFAVCSGRIAVATGLPLEMLPANAKWVLHLDVKALRDSLLGKEILASLAGTPAEAQRKTFEATTGVDVRRDVVAVTACGAGRADQGGVIYLRGNWDPEKLSASLAGNNHFASVPYGRHTLLSWDDDNASQGSERPNACLLSTNLVLFGNQEAALKQALDVLDGKAPALSTVLRFRRLASLDTNAFLRVIATDLPDIIAGNPQAAALPPADSLRLAVSSEGQRVRAKGVIRAATPEAAKQMQQVLIGLQAVAMLQGLKNPDIGRIAQSASITVNDLDVSVILTAPPEAVQRLLFQQPAGSAPHTIAAGTQSQKPISPVK